MSKYDVYRFLTESMASHYRKSFKLPRNRKNLAKEAIGMIFREYPEFANTMDAVILFEEWMLMQEGNHILFPENANLLEMLHRAKFKVDRDAFSLPHDLMAIAMPKDLRLDGQALPGCMATFLFHGRRAEVYDGFRRHYAMPDNYNLEVTNRPEGSMRSLHITYRTVLEGGEGCTRCSVPDIFIPECLEGPEQMRKVLGGYSDYTGGINLNDADQRLQHTMLRVVCAMGIYIKAFPHLLRDGYPHQDQKLKRRHLPAFTGMTLKAPEFHKAAGHGSPELHYRTWYFRSHPRRRDGTKRDGMVFVRDTVVGADVTAETVKEKI